MKRLLSIIQLIFLLFSFATVSLAAETPSGVVLVLSGGGTKGLAHIGVLKALEDNEVPVVGIVGTSIGSIIGGLAASGYTADELREIVLRKNISELMLDHSSSLFLPAGEDSMSTSPLLPSIAMDRSGKIIGPLGTLTGATLLEYFAQLASRVSVVHFDDLPIPFAAVATDLETGKKVVLRRGSLASAMRASMAIPALFEPWPIEGRLLIDGGVVSNLPVSTARQIFPGFPVVAVDVTSSLRDSENFHSVIDVIDQTITILTNQNVVREKLLANVVIRPEVGDMPLFDVTSGEQIVELGRIAAMKKIDAIRKLGRMGTLPPPSRRNHVERIVRNVRVEGLPDAQAESIERNYSYWMGHFVQSVEIVRAANELRRREDVKTVDYRLEDYEDGVTVVLSVQRRATYELDVDGYATNFHPYRWLYIDGVRRDMWTDGDVLKWRALLGKNWGSRLSYLLPEDSFFNNFSLTGAKAILEPSNSQEKKWEHYSFSFCRHMRMGDMELAIGGNARRVRFRGDNIDYFGPVIHLAFGNLDDEANPSEGERLKAHIWWPDADEIKLWTDFLIVRPLGEMWNVYLKGGFAEGNILDPSLAVYLGAQEELYSKAAHPVEAERMAWGRLGFRRALFNSWWGILYADFFGSAGFAWDNEGQSIDEPWELGMGFSIPGKFFDGKLLILRDDQDDWTLGFSVGHPFWGIHFLP